MSSFETITTLRNAVKFQIHKTSTFSDSPAELELRVILENTRIVNQIRQLSGKYQTSALESFHAVVNQFAPKSVAFSYQGMTTR